MANYPELTSDEWDELVERLTHYAACLVSCRSWRGLQIAQGGSVPGGVDPEDLAAAAITDVIEGKRSWNPESDPDFGAYLRSVVKSKVSHLVNKLENQKTRRIAPIAGESEFDAPGREPEPITICIDQESLERRRAEFLEAIKGDKLLEGLLDCLEANVTKPAEIAVLLDVTATEVNNAQKRLRRKVEGLLKITQRR